MRTLITLIGRNRKLFFRDKGMLLSSLITPIILIVLYATFLAKVYKDSFISNIVDNVSVVFDRKIKNAKTEQEKEGYRVLKESIVE